MQLELQFLLIERIRSPLKDLSPIAPTRSPGGDNEGELETIRRDLLEKELRAQGFGAEDKFELFPRLVNACYDIVNASPHENRLPPTGLILLSHEYHDYHFEGGHHYVPLTNVEERTASALADGSHSFLVRTPKEVGLVVLTRPITDELALFALRDDALFMDGHVAPSDPVHRECIVIRRASETAQCWITILGREKIVTLSRRQFSSKHYQYSFMTALRREIVPLPWGDRELQTLRSALRVAVHMLSPQGTGSALVVLTTDDEKALPALKAGGDLDTPDYLTPVNMSITLRHDQRPLVHLIGQTDGATIIGPKGDILAVGAFFNKVGKAIVANEQIAPGSTSFARKGHMPGTRHLSAMAFSKKIKGAVIVVSSDGPVTIFHNGSAIDVRNNETPDNP